MKQTIEYYYSIEINKLYVEKNAYFFTDGTYDYYFVYFPRTNTELNDLLECIKELKNKKLPIHDIMINIKNDIITKIDEINYILLKVKDKKKEYDITDIIEFNKKLRINNVKTELYRNNWANLWSSKIDYIEEQLKELNINKIIKTSINYYIGLAENAIYYVNLLNTKYPNAKYNIVLSHKRIYYPNYKLNYLNPLSFIFDLEVRDVAEYIKSVFFADGDAYLELMTYLKSVKLNNFEYNMLFVRLLYPSYYFDEYENIVNRNGSDEKILKIIDKVDSYENFLKKAYLEITKYAPLENIKWLIYQR